MDEPPQTTEFDSGFASMDGEHRVQLGLVVALADAIRQGRDRSEQDALMDHLATYTKVHFTAEHLLMRQYAYPDYQDHQLEHDELLDRVDALRRDYDAGDDKATLIAVERFQAWLTGHIRASDDRLGRFLCSHVPASPPSSDR